MRTYMCCRLITGYSDEIQFTADQGKSFVAKLDEVIKIEHVTGSLFKIVVRTEAREGKVFESYPVL